MEYLKNADSKTVSENLLTKLCKTIQSVKGPLYPLTYFDAAVRESQNAEAKATFLLRFIVKNTPVGAFEAAITSRCPNQCVETRTEQLLDVWLALDIASAESQVFEKIIADGLNKRPVAIHSDRKTCPCDLPYTTSAKYDVKPDQSIMVINFNDEPIRMLEVNLKFIANIQGHAVVASIVGINCEIDGKSVVFCKHHEGLWHMYDQRESIVRKIETGTKIAIPNPIFLMIEFATATHTDIERLEESLIEQPEAVPIRRANARKSSIFFSSTKVIK